MKECSVCKEMKEDVDEYIGICNECGRREMEYDEMSKICRWCGEKKDSVDEYRMCDGCNEEEKLMGEVEISIRKLKISDERVEILMLLVGEMIMR